MQIFCIVWSHRISSIKTWQIVWWVNLTIYLIFCCVPQALKDVEMEHLGRRSADSIRRMSSSRHSTRGRSHKRRLGQQPVTTRTEEKVKKRNMNPINVMLCRFSLRCVHVWIRWLLLHAFIHLHSRQFVRLFLLFFSFSFIPPASVCHKWIIEHLWAWTGVQISHHRHSPPASSYQEAEPQSDQWHFWSSKGKERHP